MYCVGIEIWREKKSSTPEFVLLLEKPQCVIVGTSVHLNLTLES